MNGKKDFATIVNKLLVLKLFQPLNCDIYFLGMPTALQTLRLARNCRTATNTKAIS